MSQRTLVEHALREARRQQTAWGENTAAWILWEAQIRAMERRLVGFEVDDGPPNSIIREDRR